MMLQQFSQYFSFILNVVSNYNFDLRAVLVANCQEEKSRLTVWLTALASVASNIVLLCRTANGSSS